MINSDDCRISIEKILVNYNDSNLEKQILDDTYKKIKERLKTTEINIRRDNKGTESEIEDIIFRSIYQTGFTIGFVSNVKLLKEVYHKSYKMVLPFSLKRKKKALNRKFRKKIKKENYNFEKVFRKITKGLSKLISKSEIYESCFISDREFLKEKKRECVDFINTFDDIFNLEDINNAMRSIVYTCGFSSGYYLSLKMAKKFYFRLYDALKGLKKSR